MHLQKKIGENQRIYVYYDLAVFEVNILGELNTPKHRDVSTSLHLRHQINSVRPHHGTSRVNYGVGASRVLRRKLVAAGVMSHMNIPLYRCYYFIV